MTDLEINYVEYSEAYTPTKYSTTDYLDGVNVANIPKASYYNKTKFQGELPYLVQQVTATQNRYILGQIVIDDVKRAQNAIDKFNTNKAAYDIEKVTYNEAVDFRLQEEKYADFWNRNMVELPVRPLMPSVPFDYRGLAFGVTDMLSSKFYRKVDFDGKKGGGGYLTTALLTAEIKGKSFGLYGYSI